jgi:PHD/YefM family antitoxin component YafN of YafNO toxin-antitoxin module
LSNAQTPHPDFVTDQNGKRKAVILSFEEYEELLEDLDDLAVVAERQSEETISHIELERELERDT